LQETELFSFLSELPQNLMVMADAQKSAASEKDLKKEFFSHLKSRLCA